MSLLRTWLCHSRKNPFRAKVRVITVQISSARVLDLFANDLVTAVVEIPRRYKARWQVKLFFKWLSRNPKIHHFSGIGHNAVAMR